MLVLLESLSVELLTLFDSLVEQNVFIGFDAENLARRPWQLIFLDELGKFFLSMLVSLLFHLINDFTKVLLAIGSFDGHGIHVFFEHFEMILNYANSLLVMSWFNFFVSIVVTEVSSVEDVVLKRVVMISEGLDVMRSDEPLLFVITLRQ